MHSTNASCASKGTYLRGKSVVTGGAMSLALMGCLTHAAWAQTRTEPFNTGAGNFTTQVNNGVGGNNLAWSNTNDTGSGGGGSGTGEFGGVFARTAETSAAYVADTNLGGTLSRTDLLSLSGKFIVTAQNNMDNAIVVGYIDTTFGGGAGDAAILGFAIVEPNPGPEMRVQLFSRGTAITPGGGTTGIALNTQYDFNLTYNPVTFELGGTVGPIVFAPTATGLLATDTFNGFAMLSGTAGSSNAGQSATAFFDDLTYTIVPEPASALLLVGAPLMLRRRRR